MKNYNIINLDNDNYKKIVIICNSNSPQLYFNEIISDLKETGENGKVVIDQILHVGNSANRFICLNMNNYNMEEVRIPKKSDLRKISCNFLRDNGLIEYSILTSIQIRMIEKGLAI